jgi:uncharacterized protein (TIGR03067 family)
MRPLLFALVVALVPAAAGPEPLQGTWLLQSAQREGQPLDLQGVTFRFAGDKVVVRSPQDDAKESVVRLGPAKTPAEIDVRPVNETETALGIYRLEGDVLTICTADPGQPRPTEFASRPGLKVTLLVLKRQER